MIKRDDLLCLSDQAYANLVIRQRLLRQYAERLEIIILSTRVSDDH